MQLQCHCKSSRWGDKRRVFKLTKVKCEMSGNSKLVSSCPQSPSTHCDLFSRLSSVVSNRFVWWKTSCKESEIWNLINTHLNRLLFVQVRVGRITGAKLRVTLSTHLDVRRLFLVMIFVVVRFLVISAVAARSFPDIPAAVACRSPPQDGRCLHTSPLHFTR